MPHHFEKRIVPYTPEQMYALVSDIARYPEFLPWCQGAELREISENSVTADLYVGTNGFQDKFTSHVTLDKNKAIKVSYGGGALSHLSNEWVFMPAAANACEISFRVDFAMKSRVLGLLMDSFFDLAFKKMVLSFENRAKELYQECA